MKKNDFINNLRSALKGNVPETELASQLAYYNDYVDSEIRKGTSEEAVIESLGDPRLIAKTIIDTMQDSGNSFVYESEEQSSQKSEREFKYKNFKINSWYAKLIAAIIVIAIIALVVAIGGLIGFVLLRFAIPIIIVIIFISLFRKR